MKPSAGAPPAMASMPPPSTRSKRRGPSALGSFCIGKSKAISQSLRDPRRAKSAGSGIFQAPHSASQCLEQPPAGPTLLGTRTTSKFVEDGYRGRICSNCGAPPSLRLSDRGDTPPESPVASTASTPQHFTGPMAGSLNTIIEHLWPRISAYTSEMITQEVEPALQANLPTALKSASFDPSKCHLGEKPVQFRRVHIQRLTQHTAQGSIQNLCFQARVSWDADCSVVLRFAHQSLGIKGFKIRGVLLLELVGLMDIPPFFEGIRAFFVNPPEIDVEFQGAGQGLLNLRLVRNKIVDILSEGIRDQLVLPNRVGYAIAPEADIFCIKCPPAEGILTVTVHCAKDLLPMDTSWFGRPSSDPYVVIQCGAHRFRSPTKYKTLAPNFAFTVSFPVTEAAHQRIRVELYDEDLLSSDDFLGRLSLPVQTLRTWGSFSKVTSPLTDEAGEKGKNGIVTMSAEWRPLRLHGRLAAVMGSSARAEDQRPQGPGLVFAGIASASRLSRQGEGSQYWATVRCSGVMPHFPLAKTETDRIVEFPAEGPEENPTLQGTMRTRLEVLQKYNMSEEDMAKVLQVELQALRECMLSRSATEAAGELAKLDVSGSHEVHWDNGFQFPVESVSAASVAIDVMSQVPGGSALKVGTFAIKATDIMSCPDSTTWKTVELSGTTVLLRLKLSVRYLGNPVLSL